MMETGKCICKYFLLRDTHLKVENNTIHNNITPGGITDMVKPQACTGFIMDSRKTQSAKQKKGKKIKKVRKNIEMLTLKRESLFGVQKSVMWIYDHWYMQ